MAKLISSFTAPFLTKVRKGGMFGFRHWTEKVFENTRRIWKYVVQRSGRVPKKPSTVRVTASKYAVIQEKSVAPFKQSLSLPRQVFANLFPRVRLETVAADWRRRAALHLASFRVGNGTRRLPLLAFVGLAFADSSSNISQTEKNILFAQIRKLHSSKAKEANSDEENCILDLSRLEFGELIDQGCHAAVYEARYVDSAEQRACAESTVANPPFLSDGDFNLAVKMMFNYDTESNAEAILRAMVKEGVPYLLHQELDMLLNRNQSKRKQDGAAHPNIVAMYDVFEDEMPDLPSNLDHYPAALPARINPNGFGRNSTMFIVMKRYDCTLSNFLSKESPDMASRCLLFAQLLEGVVFLQRQGIAHRDLKTDNILLDLSFSEDCPLLIITDFGCCVCDQEGLRIPYNTGEISKGGNAALMAPEIACAEVSQTSVLDYRKADLWTTGAIAYEIFGLDNPFYRSKKNPQRLDSRTYKEEQLPCLPAEVPRIVEHLIQNILCRNKHKRLQPAVAATVMQLSLWAPRRWIEFPSSISLPMIQDWVVSCAAQLLCHLTNSNNQQANTTNVVKQTFLSRISYHDLKEACSFIQDGCNAFSMSHL